MSPDTSSTPPISRRHFLLGAASLATLTPVVRASVSLAMQSPLPLPDNAVLVFQGDSITDAGRDRSRTGPNDPAALARGYVGRIADALLALHRDDGWKIFNRGVSGNRSVDLLARWRVDTLALHPDLVSILVGVNDTWHEHLAGSGISVARYAGLCRMILEDTREALPNCRLVLCEPFALPGGAFQDAWMGELRERSAIVRQLAQEFDAAFVPFQSMFDEAQKEHSAAELAADGVHPTELGHDLMAQAWRKAAVL